MPVWIICLKGVYSNLALQWCLNLKPFFLDIHRVLKPGGRLVMSTFGPATLQELKQSWKTVDAFTHVNDFCDAEQLAGSLEQVGFGDITLQTRKYISYYPDVIALMNELKAIGAHNACPDRKKQLTGKRQLQEMITAYQQFQTEDRVPATYEVIYLAATRN